MPDAETPPPPAPPPAAPTARRARAPRGGCLWRLFTRAAQAAVLAVVALVAVLLGWVRSDDFRGRVVKLVETVLEGELGEEVTLGDVEVQFWPPAVEATGLTVFAAGAAEADDDTNIVTVERIRVPVVIRDGRPGIGQLVLQRPSVALHLDDAGRLVEFRNRKQRSGGKPLERLPWSSLRVIDGSVRLDFRDGHVALDSLDVFPYSGPLSELDAELSYRFRDLSEETSVLWRDVQLGPDLVDVPELHLDLDTLDVSGHLRAAFAGPLDGALSAHVALEELNPALAPPRAAHGALDLDVTVEGTAKEPLVGLVVAGEGLGFDAPGVFTPLLTYEFGAVRAAATATKAGVEIRQLVLPWADGRITAWGRITPERRLEDAHILAEDVRLLPLLKAFDAAPTPWVDFRADAELAVAGTLQPLRLEGDFELGVANLHVGNKALESPGVGLLLDLPSAQAQGRLVFEKDHILLDAERVRSPRNSGVARVDIGFGPKGPLDLHFDLAGADLRDFQPLANVGLRGVGHVWGDIVGPFNHLVLTGHGEVDDFEVLGLHYADHLSADLYSDGLKGIALERADATLGRSHYTGRYAIDFRAPISMQTEIAVDRGRIEDMVHMFLDLDGLRGDLSGTLWLDGPIYDLDGEAHLGFRDVDLYGEKFPVGEGHGYLDRGTFTLDDLRVRRAGGAAGLTLRGSVDRKWALDMELVGDGLQLQSLDRLAPSALPIEGDLAVHARITNTLFDPSPDGRITLTRLRYADARAGDSVLRVDTTGGVARYTGELLGGAATVEGTLGLWGEQPYALRLALDQLPAHVFYPTAADGRPVTAVVDGTVDVSGDFGLVWSPVALDARLDRVEVGWGEHHLRNQQVWHYHQDGNVFEARDVGLAGGLTDLVLSASGGGSAGLQVAGAGVVDLRLLGAVVPGIDRASGTAAVTMSAEGVRPNVEAVVDVAVDAEVFRHASAPLTFEDATAHLRVRQDRIELLDLQAGLGGGTFGGRGTMEAESWYPVRYDLAFEAADAQVQWVESLPPAIGDGQFRFDGPAGALLLSGRATVTDMVFADRIDWEDWVVEYRDEMLVDPASLSDAEPMFSLNVEIAADHTIRLRNNVVEGVASADLRILGDTERPGLVGTVTVEDGIVFLQDREFRMDRGVLAWNDPWSWDPLLDLSLQTDILNQDQRYRVDYLVTGPFSDWRSSSRSDPPLPQADVNALLWFGMTTDQLEAMGQLSSAVAQGVADLIVTDFFVSGQFGELGVSPDLLFDRFDIATGVNARGQYSPEPRLLLEKRLDELEVDLKWELNIVRPNDSYVSATRRIGGIWSLSGWYATLQRNRVLPIGGAYGVDVTARWELE